MNKKILYLDMDGVIVDFYSHPTLKVDKSSWNDPQIFKEGYFYNLKPTPMALHTVDQLTSMKELDVYILTHGLAGSHYCYAEKVQWIKQFLPQLTNRMIITCNKLLNKGDILVDDDKRWGGFEGQFIEFTPQNLLKDEPGHTPSKQDYAAMWGEVLELIKRSI